ncbi:MAG: hypothetical protein LN568_03385 [Rickettsia endosymbiont of Pseudomimeciton antennatum]|nr:hypothetical protein [Rickettsia endosymbiont of Pseudomimeciton antennatum]
MSKSKKYIDLEETMLFTCNNLYDYSLKILPSLFAITDEIPDDQGLPPKVIEGFTPEIITEMYKTVNRYLTGALLFGKAEATLGLAYLHREGLGVDESEYHDTLYRYIGAELGDQTCKVLLLQQDHRLQIDYRYVVPE